MAGIDTHRELGPDMPLFSADGGPKLSARQVKAALDAYQVYLDEPLRMAGPWRGTITVRDIVTWLHAGCPSGDLAYLIRHERPAPSSNVPPALTPPVSSAPAEISSVDTAEPDRALEPIAPAEPLRPWRDRLMDMATNPVAWMWVWAIFCGLGFGSRFFIQSDPELTVWGITRAAMLALFGGAAVVFSLFGVATEVVGRGHNTLWNIVVSGVVGLGTAIVASHSYADAYGHLHANQLAPLATLVEQCMDDGIRYESYRVAAVCRDGWQSGATGEGACSHHGGVARWIHPSTQTRTVQECRQMASDTSWLSYYTGTTK